MRKMIAETLFDAVCFGFSALLLVLSLLTGMQTTAVNDRAAAHEREIKTLRKEIAILDARCESSVPLAVLEQYAVSELGLQHPRSAQVVYIDLG